jgi:hypothetical protein
VTVRGAGGSEGIVVVKQATLEALCDKVCEDLAETKPTLHLHHADGTLVPRPSWHVVLTRSHM